MKAESDPTNLRSPRAAKIAAVGAALGALAVAYALGLFDRSTDPAALARKMVDLGGWGYLAFVVAYAALQPFGVPGTLFIMAAPLIWPWPSAFALSMTGTMAASVIGFSFARFVARDWVKERIPARFRKYDDALAARAFTTVLLLRFVFWMPPLLHAFFGVSQVRFWTHFWGSLAGYIVPLFLVSYFGEKLFQIMKNAPAGVWVGIAASVVVLAAGTWAWRRRGAARRPRSARSGAGS